MLLFSETPSSEDDWHFVCRRGMNSIAYFGVSSVKYISEGTAFTVTFPGSNSIIPECDQPTGSVTNYFIGNDPSKWQSGLADYTKLRYSNIYPGIDLVYKIHDDGLKYEFVVAPYADPTQIMLEYENAASVEIVDDSFLVEKAGVQIADKQLRVFQRNEEVQVGCSFVLSSDNRIGFELDEYDPTLELTIDPLLILYSTYISGSDRDFPHKIAVEDGYVYIAGETQSLNYPMVSPYNSTQAGTSSCFVTKLSQDGMSLVFSTYLGGSDLDDAHGIAVEDGHVYVCGLTRSSDFPMVVAFNSTYGGVQDCFVTKIHSSGQALLYSTYLGGSDDDKGEDIAVEDGCAYITGSTRSANFPTTTSAYDTILNGSTDAFVAKLNASGWFLVFSTFLGGSSGDNGYGIAVEDGYAYLTGYTASGDFPTENAFDYSGSDDAFVTKLNSSGQNLIYSSYLGGPGGFDVGADIDVEQGSAYIVGQTLSMHFPIANAYDSDYNNHDDCFVAKIASTGWLSFSTYLGGSSTDWGKGIAVEDGFVYVTGYTASIDFPTVNAYNSSRSGTSDCFVTKFTEEGRSLLYSSYIGGSVWDSGKSIAVQDGFVYLTGSTMSDDFPTVNAYNSTYGGDVDCFVLKLADGFDSDADGLLDWEENSVYGTDPHLIDTDFDNFLDGYEVTYGSDPLDPLDYPAIPQVWYNQLYTDLDQNSSLIQEMLQAVDYNANQILVLTALITGNTALLNSLNATHLEYLEEIQTVIDTLGVSVGDSDYDGLDDLSELFHGTDPLCIDTDTDNLNDAYEVKIGTDPLDDDSDGDFYLDGEEIIAGTDPLDPLSYPGASQGIDTTLVVMIIGGIGVAVVVLFLLIKRRKG
jgi:hypothetical protein